MRLARPVVRILAEQEDADIVKGSQLEGRIHVLGGRVDGVVRPLVGDERLQLGPVGLVEFACQRGQPRVGQRRGRNGVKGIKQGGLCHAVLYPKRLAGK